MLTCPAWIFWRTHSIPSSSISIWSRSKGHSTSSVPTCTCTSCMYMYFPPYREGKAWNTRQSSPESWPAYLVSGRLISQLVQGRSDTVKSITTQFGHWWFIRYKQIYCHYTSNFHHIIGENYSFYSPRSRNSHFHHINSAKYHTFHIYTIYKLFKNSRKQHISYLLKNHCFWHFSPFWHFSRSAKITQFQEKPKNGQFWENSNFSKFGYF